jgi:DNA topoisomerase-1
LTGASRGTRYRVRRVDCSTAGIRRRRRGKGFEYLDKDGNRITEPSVLERIRELAIPPAWQDVWICPHPMGHIQATGTDAAGRKQYRYHDRWRERRDAQKFESMIRFGRSLPKLRRRVAKDLARPGIPRERALACAVRLLDRGFFRIGSEGYAEENDTYGIATMRKRHVTVSGDQVTFDYEAKGGQRRLQAIGDPDVAGLVRVLKQRRGGGEELLAYKVGRRWVDVKSADINEYVKAVAGEEFSAKDFRTWSGTVLAAVALAVSGPARGTKSSRKRAKARAVKEVARYLGNTPAVARSSYIDPRVFDRFDGGLTIAGVLPELADDTAAWPDLQGAIEEAVLDLLAKDRESKALERAEDLVDELEAVAA